MVEFEITKEQFEKSSKKECILMSDKDCYLFESLMYNLENNPCSNIVICYLNSEDKYIMRIYQKCNLLRMLVDDEFIESIIEYYVSKGKRFTNILHWYAEEKIKYALDKLPFTLIDIIHCGYGY